MIDVSSKSPTLRTARTVARLKVGPAALSLLKEGGLPKGDPLAVAKVAAIQAAKNTSQIIPYCHPLPIEFVGVEFEIWADHIQVAVTVKAGDGPSRLKEGHAAKIHTGAMLPRGADAILVREEAQDVEGHLKVPHPVSEGDHVRPRGGEFDSGAVVLSAGTMVTPPVCGLLAELGRDRVRVHRLPRVALLVTGDELRPVGAKLSPGQIYDANSSALKAALSSLGIQPVRAACAPDRPQPLLATVRKGLRASDVLVVAGGRRPRRRGPPSGEPSRYRKHPEDGGEGGGRGSRRLRREYHHRGARPPEPQAGRPPRPRGG